MPSTFSTSLRLELIGDGEQSGVWGQTTNNNLGDLLEQAVAGRTTLDVTSGNITLTSLNGVVDEARSAVLAVTGTPGVTRVLTIPNVNKTYTVINQTTNIIQVKTASGAAFDCPPSATAVIACDGLNGIQGSGIAPLTSPAFTGVPVAPTAAAATNTTQLATTAFVFAERTNTATLTNKSLTSPALTGTPTAPTASVGTNTTQVATTAFVNAEIASDTANLAPLASPAFTGVPTAPTAAAATNTTQLATTAFVFAERTNTATLTNKSLTSPALTGTPTAPTASAGTNTTQIATTAFVTTAIALGVPTGVITLWSGSIASIPAGWLLCDGTSGTPDLRDRFVVGAGSTYAVADTGGANTVTLDTTQIPSHTHTGSASSTSLAHTHTFSATSGTTNIAHTHTGTSDTTSIAHTHTGSGTTSDQSANHVHSGTTSTIGDHVHGSGTLYSQDAGSGNIKIDDGGGDNRVPFVNRDSAAAGAHNHTITTDGVSANHNHTYSFTTSSSGPTHSHPFTTDSSDPTHSHSVSGTTGAMSANETHTHTITNTDTGGGLAHENRPPYFALAYIMRVA